MRSAMENCFRSDVVMIVHLIQLKVPVCPFWSSLALAIRMGLSLSRSLSAPVYIATPVIEITSPSHRMQRKNNTKQNKDNVDQKWVK